METTLEKVEVINSTASNLDLADYDATDKSLREALNNLTYLIDNNELPSEDEGIQDLMHAKSMLKAVLLTVNKYGVFLKL